MENENKEWYNEKWYDNDITRGVMKAKYFHEGETEPDQLLHRVANAYSDDIKDEVYDRMERGEILPAGRTLFAANADPKIKVSASNCYISESPEDTLNSIFNIARDCAIIGSRGGGVGICLSNLRPSGCAVNNSVKFSTGIKSFLKLYNQTGEIIGQMNRHMAMMIALDVWHPDVFEFMDIKHTEKLSAANISLKLDDKFMKAVKADTDYELHFDVKSTGEKIRRNVKARSIWKSFCQYQYEYGDPGALFINRIKSYNLLSGYPEYKIEVSNPCGEYLANAGNSCLLQSINLYRFVENKFTKDAKVNYKELEKCATFCVKMMNQTQAFGYSRQPLDINRENIDEWCSIGLGVMGLGDMFVALGLKYGEKKSIDISKEIMHTIFRGAVIGSALVAKETKKTFGKYDWEKTKKSPLLKKLAHGKDVDKYAYELVKKYGLANGSLISIAPTGSISLAAGGFSGGVEPLYKVSYIRTTHSAEDKEKKFFFRVFSKGVYDLLRHDGIDPESLNNDEIIKRYPFITESHEIDYNDRIKMQSAMQIWTDNAISSTVNLKHEATVEQISDIYLKAWAAGLKGITVFRDNCGGRENILDAKEDEKQGEIIENGILDNNKVKKLDFIKPMKRRNVRVLNAINVRNDTACVNGFYTTIDSTEDGHVFDLFVDTRSGCKTNIQAISGLISLATRSGVRTEEIINELKLHTCRNCQDGIKKGKDISLSCPIAIAESLSIAYKDLKKKHPENAEKNVTPKKDKTSKKKIEHIKIGDPSMAECPECHEHTLIPDGKCVRCPNCGYSKC